MTKMMTMTNKSLKILRQLFFIGFLLIVNQANAHKFYMSICDMEYNPKSKSLQVVIKFFADDLEYVLEKESSERIFIGTPKEHEKTDTFLQEYLNKHFIVEQKKGSLNYNYIGKETDKDYTWVYLEYKNFKPDDSAFLTNNLFISYFKEQANKVNYTNGKLVNSFTLHQNKIAEEF